jgi:hypothetical protein
VDQFGSPRFDAAWTVDNTSLGTIATNSAAKTGSFATLTALAAGTVTLTATVQGLSAHMPVTISSAASFPPGTILWSAPSVPGFSPQQIVQAVPTDLGPDVYAVQKSSDGTQSLVQALTADGQQMFQLTAPPLAPGGMSDALGNFVGIGTCDTVNPLSIITVSVFGGEGPRPFPSLAGGACPAGVPKLAARQDGAVVVTGPLQLSPALMILDQNTGNQFPAPLIPPSTFTGKVFGQDPQAVSCDCFTRVGQPMVDSDGSAYVEYNVREVTSNVTTSAVLSLLKIAPDGTAASVTQLTSSSSGNDGEIWPGVIIPDGQGGVLATWIVGPSSFSGVQGPNPYQAAHVTPDGGLTPYVLPMAPTQVLNNNAIPIDLSLVLGENGIAFVSYPTGTNVVSFNLNSGAIIWNSQAPSQSALSMIASTAGNGLVAKTSAQGIDTVTRLDSTGALTQDAWSGSSVGFLLGDMWLGSTSPNGPISAIFAASFDWAFSVWPQSTSNGTNQAKKKIKVLVSTVAGAGVSTQYIQDKVNTGINAWQTKAGILFDWDQTVQQPLLLGCDPNNPPPGNTCVSGGSFDITNDTLLSQMNEVLRRLWPPPSRVVKLLFVNQLGPNNENVGYTPPEYKNAEGITNLSLFQNNSSNSVMVAHELGHVLGLTHVNNPINLMCGSTGNPWKDAVTYCWSTITKLLSDDQINQARKSAALLVEP